MRTTVDEVIDVLHGAGVPGFTYDPAVDPPIATVKGGGGLGGADHWWASCRPCWWWDEDDDTPTASTPAEAQQRADDHNRIHHPNHKETAST